jgi:hypothetical protein
MLLVRLMASKSARHRCDLAEIRRPTLTEVKMLITEALAMTSPSVGCRQAQRNFARSEPLKSQVPRNFVAAQHGVSAARNWEQSTNLAAWSKVDAAIGPG